MARPIASPAPLPKFTLTSQYAVERLGAAPTLIVRTSECVFKLRPALVITSSEDLDNDGLHEVLHVSAATADASLVGHPVSDALSTQLAVITASENTVVNEVITGVTLTLSVGLTTPQLAAPVHIVELNTLGAPHYLLSPLGRTWTVAVSGESAAGMQEIATRMGSSYFNAGRALLTQLGITTVTDQALFGAIAALAASGVNIDTFLAEQADLIEDRRAAGLLPFVQIMGGPLALAA